MSDEDYVIDLRTGKKVSWPNKMEPYMLSPGETLGPQHLIALLNDGEDKDVVRTLSAEGAKPYAYQPVPDGPEYPVDISEDGEPQIRGTIAAPGGGGGGTIQGEFKGLITGDYYKFCKNGKPAGMKFTPPGEYNGQYYVRGAHGNIYQWTCGTWVFPPRGSQKIWLCCGYQFLDNDYFAPAKNKVNLDKLPKYHC